MLQEPKWLLFNDPGAGKTRTVLSWLKHTHAKALVLVPSIASIDTWVRESEFTPELTCLPLTGSSVDNQHQIKQDVDLYVMCYQSAVAMVSAKHGTKWALNPKLIAKCFGHLDALVVDESQRCKNSSSLTWKMCRMVAKRVKYVYGLTGTPFKDPIDLWAQFYLIDNGDTLGPTLGFYREIFFTKKFNFWGGYEFNFKKRLMPQLRRMIKNKSIRYEVNEYSDIEKPIYIPIKLRLPAGAKSYIDQAKSDLQQAVIDGEYHVAGNSFSRLRQLSSGFVTFDNDVDKVKIELDSNPKLDSLCELLETIPQESKVVVFHEFIFTNELISNRLTSLKINHARIWGGQRNPLDQLKKFREDPTYRVLVINIRSGSASLNLQFANYVVFFDQPISSVDRIQAEARCWRSGQTRRVFVYDLLMDSTYDTRIHQAVKQGQDLLSLLINKQQEV